MNVRGVPWQPLAVGVTVIVPEMGAFVVLVALNTGKAPVPDAPNPIAVLSFVHANVVPDTGPEKLIVEVFVLLQKLALFTGLTAAVGYTVMVNVLIDP